MIYIDTNSLGTDTGSKRGLGSSIRLVEPVYNGKTCRNK